MNLENKTGFVAFNFPYPGSFSNAQGWEVKYFPDVNSNVVYKNYVCTSDNFCNTDSGDIEFIVNGSLNSIRSFNNLL